MVLYLLFLLIPDAPSFAAPVVAYTSEKQCEAAANSMKAQMAPVFVLSKCMKAELKPDFAK